MTVFDEVAEGLQDHHALFVAFLSDQFIEKHVPAVSENFIHRLIRILSSFIVFLGPSCFGSLFLIATLLFSKLGLSLLLSFSVLEGLRRLLGVFFALFLFFRNLIVFCCVSYRFCWDGFSLKLPPVFGLVLLSILVLLAVLQEPNAIAFAKLTNYQFQLFPKFDLNPT